MKSCNTFPRQQQGFSLVEIMVASVIALFLLAGVVTLFGHSQESAKTTNNLNIMQDNGRFAIELIARTLRQAGFRTPPGAGTEIAFKDFSDIFSPGNHYIDGIAASGPNNSDTLIIRYQGQGDGAGQPNGNMLDCLGAGVDANVMSENRYSINENNQLVCQAINHTTVPATDTTRALVDHVENFRVLYGEDTSGDGIANRYVGIDYPGLNLNKIVSVKVAILTHTPEEVNREADENTYNMLGADVPPAADDRRIRRVYTSTFFLRNRTL